MPPCGGTASARTRRAPGPDSDWFVFESTRWLRHQQTFASGLFFGPSIVATSAKRVAGRTSIAMLPTLGRFLGAQARVTA